MLIAPVLSKKLKTNSQVQLYNRADDSYISVTFIVIKNCTLIFDYKK